MSCILKGLALAAVLTEGREYFEYLQGQVDAGTRGQEPGRAAPHPDGWSRTRPGRTTTSGG